MVVGWTNTELLLLLLDPCSPPMKRKPNESKDSADRVELNVLRRNRYYRYLLHTGTLLKFGILNGLGPYSVLMAVPTIEY